MLKQIWLHSNDLRLPPSHPLHDHMFILKHYRSTPTERERMGIPPDDPGVMEMQLRKTGEDPLSINTVSAIPVADLHSLSIMWNAFIQKDTAAVLRGYGMENAQ